MLNVLGGARLASCVAVSLLLASPSTGAQATQATSVIRIPDHTATKIDANYRITLNGFELGAFRFNSRRAKDQYILNTDVELSALLGMFHWKGETRSTGHISAQTPQPAGFSFQFQSTVQSGSIRIGFNKEGVKTLSVEPAEFAVREAIPLKRADLRQVFDPLSAILALTHVAAPTPCGRTIPIFDGKQRFNIDLKYARKERLAGTKEVAIVCRVKYQPISGYTPNSEIRALAASNGIEIAFRPVPSINLMLPQFVKVPTPAGEARLDLTRIGIKAPATGGKLASAN